MDWFAENLTVTRGSRPVLEGVSFNVAAGEALILRGRNGGGKTTLLRTLAGLNTLASGRVGAQSPLPFEDLITYAGHADGLKPQLSVLENYQFWATLYAQKGREQKAIDAFSLEPLKNRAFRDLSAGQKRRAGLGRLLLTGRPIWLLDEPTVSLDVHHVAKFGDILKDHLSAGGSALIATHIDLGLKQARILDLTHFKATVHAQKGDPFGESIE